MTVSMVSAILLLGLFHWSASPFVSAFLSSDSWPRGSTALSYFDDVSRDHTTFGWTPTGGPGYDGVGAGGAKEKMEAMQRRLFGHDLSSASSLSDSQIEDETREWIKDIGLVRQLAGEETTSGPSAYFGDGDTYGGLLGVSLSKSSTLVGCLASFWRSVVSFIDDIADEADKVEHSRLFLQIFPQCEQLYDYDTFTLLKSAVEFCQDSCTHYGHGKRFKLALYHPRYENAPKMIYPEHHSPFPSLGLHVFSEAEARADNDDEGGDEIVRIGEAGDPKEEITSSDIADHVTHLSKKKKSLEKLFNSPAAVSSVADSRAFGHTHQVLSSEDVIAASSQWIVDQSSESPPSLKYMDTLIDDMAKVSDATTAEQAYADIWEQISILYDAGKENVHSAEREVEVISSLFIVEKYASYNASEFKRFAVTVNAALKHLTGGKMFLELFHPEYVGAKHASRRSPYPMIQICYRVRT